MQKAARRGAGRIFQCVDAAGELCLPGLQVQCRHAQLCPGKMQDAPTGLYCGAVCIAILFVVRIICFFQVCSGKAKDAAIIGKLPFLK